MRKSLPFSALLLLCLPLSPGQATSVGVPVPKPTATGQSLYSGPYQGGFQWQPVTLPYASNGTQSSFGGSVDTGSRLSVSPSGASENGLTVNMPSGATGNAFQTKTSTGTLGWSIKGGTLNYYSPYSASTLTIQDYQNVSPAFNGFKFACPVFFSAQVRSDGGFNTSTGGYGLTLTSNGFASGFSGALNYRDNYAVWHMYQSGGYGFPVLMVDGQNQPSQPPLVIRAASSQAVDITDFQIASGSVVASIDKSGDIITTGYVNSPAYQVGGVAGYTGSIPTTAQSLSVHAGIITGFISSAGTQVGSP